MATLKHSAGRKAFGVAFDRVFKYINKDRDENMVKLIKEAVRFIKDPEQDFNERIFLILTLVSEVAVFIAFIGDLLTHEDPIELFILIGALVFVPIITFVCLIHNHLGIAIKVIVICFVTLVLPMLFFFGGGLRGGGVLWIIFAFLYVGLVLRGRWRNTMFVLITVLTLGCYLVGYYFPRFIHAHSTAMYYVDSFISLVLIGIMGFVMTWSQGRLFTNEDGVFVIGRIAVMKDHRGLSLGSRIVTELEKQAKDMGGKSIALSAQCRVRGFYEKLGYTAAGDLHDDEGCPHVTMIKDI